MPKQIGIVGSNCGSKVNAINGSSRHQCDVIPSVSNDNLCRMAVPVKMSLTSEEIATNIDSGEESVKSAVDGV
mgnify:CR=1 FL=1